MKNKASDNDETLKVNGVTEEDSTVQDDRLNGHAEDQEEADKTPVDDTKEGLN